MSVITTDVLIVTNNGDEISHREIKTEAADYVNMLDILNKISDDLKMGSKKAYE